MDRRWGPIILNCLNKLLKRLPPEYITKTTEFLETNFLSKSQKEINEKKKLEKEEKINKIIEQQKLIEKKSQKNNKN